MHIWLWLLQGLMAAIYGWIMVGLGVLGDGGEDRVIGKQRETVNSEDLETPR